MAISYESLTERHPCFAKGRAGTTGRLHLPVSPTCNIRCVFCERSINAKENRPGVTREVISPEEAVEAVGRAVSLCNEIEVAGIAGPGDTLASPYALQTFTLLGQKYPNLVKCMSTNGLLLPEKALDIIKAGVDSLTVTVNAVDPEIEAKLNDGILYHGRRFDGVEAAEILIRNQLEGIRIISAAGITVKVNTVLVPRINGNHIGEIARQVSEAGATIYNIIPLIPTAKLKDEQEPTCLDLFKARLQAEKYISVFRHCQRCRADAVGVPGKSEYSSQVYLHRVAAKATFSHG